jgi:hypothetical protein
MANHNKSVDGGGSKNLGKKIMVAQTERLER